MRLEDIGFYTLSDERAQTSSIYTPLWRCELILGARCNFRCPYCRHIGGRDLAQSKAEDIVRLWANQGLKNIRFSGGEPTLQPGLTNLVKLSKELDIERIAISTNGSADYELYQSLIDEGANDLSISLDACCAEDGDKMAGNKKGSWNKVVDNIRQLSKLTYVTVGVVLTDQNISIVNETIEFAHNLGVSDIRIIPAAQNGDKLKNIYVNKELLDVHPILRYRVQNIQNGLTVRGLSSNDPNRCSLVLDDMAVMGEEHYPCIIYMREQGKPIGKVGLNMRLEREEWSKNHDTHKDPICKKNCLDVCINFNRKRWRTIWK